MPAWWVSGLASSTRTAARELDDAKRTFAAQTTKLRRRMLVVVGFYVLFLGGILGLAAWSAHGRPPTPDFAAQPRWWNHSGEPRDLMRRYTAGAAGWSLGFTTIAFTPSCATAPIALPLAARDCDATGCTLWLYAALRDGEHAHLMLTGPTPSSTRKRRICSPVGPPSHTADLGYDAGHVTLHANQPAELVATWRTWYQLAIHIPNAAPTSHVAACFNVD